MSPVSWSWRGNKDAGEHATSMSDTFTPPPLPPPEGRHGSPTGGRHHANSDAMWRPTASQSWGAAEIDGSTVVPPIVVGAPSPVVEPTVIGGSFKPLPYRPDTIIDGWTVDGMTVRGASLRGHLHRFNGTPREDDFAIHRLADGRVIALVADGVSQAHQSHIGSAVAVRSAAEWLQTTLPFETAAADWQHCFASVAWTLNEQAKGLLGLAQPDPVATETLLATTLVCAVIETTKAGTLRAHLAAVGDSSAWLLSESSFHDVLQPRDASAAITSSEVTGLPRVPRTVEPIVVDLHPGEVLLIGTDGCGDPLGTGEGGVGNLFRQLLGQARPPSQLEFAHALDFSREAFDDDRTLVAVWPPESRNTQGDMW